MTTFNILDRIASKVVVRNVTIKEFMAEFLGTLVLVVSTIAVINYCNY